MTYDEVLALLEKNRDQAVFDGLDDVAHAFHVVEPEGVPTITALLKLADVGQDGIDIEGMEGGRVSFVHPP